MMIGPDTYYEINLKGKDKEYILSAIREMQDEIARLKELMENPDHKDRTLMYPSEDVQIKCAREYIARAIQAYEGLGGTYKMSKLEKADLEFQRNIGNISKISFEIGGFFEGRTEYVIEFAGNDALLSQSKIYSYDTKEKSVIDREGVLDALQDLHIGEWEKCYDPMRFGYCVLDGTQWSITFEYSNGKHTLEISGSNDYPYNFDEFAEIFDVEIADD
ncbi:MAG: hypothetical protein PUF60_00715 [Firmicutes bacterium]|nr:hypothetical protein [Bacillota bacterium]